MKNQLIGTMAVVALATSANAVIIDDFSVDQMVMATSASTDASAVNGAGIIGGERELIARNVVGSGALSEVVNMTTEGKLDFSLDVDTIGQGKIVYDGDDNPDGSISDSSPNRTGLGGIDFTADGHTALALGVCIADFPFEVIYRVWDMDENDSSYTLAIPGGIFADTEFLVPFSDFTGSADFSNIGAVKVLINPMFGNTDLQLDYIRTDVPTPGALALAGAAGLLGARRRRR